MCAMIATNIFKSASSFFACMYLCVVAGVSVDKSIESERERETVAIEETFILFPTYVSSYHFFISPSIVVWCADSAYAVLAQSFSISKFIRIMSHFHSKPYPNRTLALASTTHTHTYTIPCHLSLPLLVHDSMSSLHEYNIRVCTYRSFIYLFTDSLGNCLRSELRIQISNQTNQNLFVCLLLFKVDALVSAKKKKREMWMEIGNGNCFYQNSSIFGSKEKAQKAHTNRQK